VCSLHQRPEQPRQWLSHGNVTPEESHLPTNKKEVLIHVSLTKDLNVGNSFDF
jgi:hypothetical protein